MVIGQAFAAGTVGGLCAHPLAPTFLTTARRAFPTIQFEQLGAQGADVGYGVEHYEQLNRAAKGALSVEERSCRLRRTKNGPRGCCQGALEIRGTGKSHSAQLCLSLGV